MAGYFPVRLCCPWLGTVLLRLQPGCVPDRKVLAALQRFLHFAGHQVTDGLFQYALTAVSCHRTQAKSLLQAFAPAKFVCAV